MKTIAVAGAGVTCWVVYGCSLGLDASKIGAGKEDATISPGADASPEDGAAGDASDAGVGDADASGGTCRVNTDCTSANECLVGTCDAGACTFAVCPSGTCQGSSCLANTLICSAPAAYGFEAATITVTSGGVGCGGNPSACLAAAYPFVFVGTTSGVVAYAVNDPSNSSPPAVPVAGLAFVPSFITATGSRVYFVGAPQAGGPTYPIAIASVDVPDNPLATSLQATAVLDSVTVAQVTSAWAATDGSLYLVDNDGTGTFPTAKVTAPLTSGTALTFYSSPGIPAGGSPVVPSGSRLLVAQWEAATTPYQTAFSFETSAGTQGAQSSAEEDGGVQPTYASIGPTTPQWAFAQGSDGSDLWNAETAVIDDAGALQVSDVRLAWLVASGTTAQISAAEFVNVEQYSPPVAYGAPLVGPVAWVDSNTALVLAAAHETINPPNPPETSVQVALLTPTPSIASGRRSLITQTIGQVGAAASGGFGYVLATNTPSTTCTLHIFAPSCAAAP